MENNIDIFIGAHKSYTFPTNPIYKIIYNGSDKLNTVLSVYKEEQELLHDLYGDVIRIDWIYNNIKDLKRYVGLVQYRRYFDFYNNVPDIDKIFLTHDIIIPNKFSVQNLYDQYVQCHDEASINPLLDILHEKYPEYESTVEEWKQINYVIPHNMFIMKQEDFIKFHNFLFNIFNEYIKRLNIKSMDDVAKLFKPRASRAIGFLSERLTTIYYKHNFTNPKYINVIMK